MAMPAFGQAALRLVVAYFGESWTYRTLTSAYDAETRTYAGAVAFTTQVVGRSVGDDFDSLKNAFVRRERVVLKCSDAIILKEGDHAINAASVEYHIDGIDDATTSDGLIRYRASRALGLLAQVERGGGI